jgi:DNA repair exonuclease SbcCD ATPase subunit
MTEINHSIDLTKTSILQGIQCPKALYLSKNPPPIEIPPDPDLEAKFRMGKEVGLLARQLFPGGIEVPFSDLSFSEQISKTKELMAAGVNVIYEGADIIYEASFAFGDIFIKADILVRNGATWEINEVKMSTSIKDPNYDDAAIQYYVIANSGLSVSGVNLIHINNQYERQGDMSELKQSLVTKQKEHAKIEKEYDQKRHAEVRLIKEKLLSDVATIKSKIDSLSKDKLRLEEEIKKMKQIKKEIKDMLAQKKKLEEKEELVKFLRNKIFNNVSAQLSERFREEISLRADIIYRSIAETDEELFWGDKYQIVLRDMLDGEVRERTDDQLSGGQIMSAVVALRLALLQTIGARVAFFDEPTSNLDAARRANLAHAFRAIDVGREEVTEHWYDQLFLISHDVTFTEITDQIISLE